MATNQKSQRFLSRLEVMDKVGKSYPTLWAWMREGSFPRARDVGQGEVAWLESEVDAWMDARPLRIFKGEKVARPALSIRGPRRAKSSMPA